MISKIPSAHDHGSTSQISEDKDKRLADERDKRLAEERAQAALKLQRKQRLEAMVQKRKTNLAYLKKVHEGGCYWLNVVLFTSADIKQYIDAQITKQRTESYFYLGLSVSKILSLPAGTSTVRAFSQLIEEWEYYHNGNTLQSVKYVMAKNSSCMYPQVTPIEGGGMTDLQRPSVYKFNQTIVYEYLHIMHIPYQLDHVEVLIGLCDALSKLYDKILHEECYSNQVVYDTIVRLDSRVKHHLINLVGKELTELGSRKVKASTGQLRAKTGIMHAIKQFFVSGIGSGGSGGGGGGSKLIV